MPNAPRTSPKVKKWQQWLLSIRKQMTPLMGSRFMYNRMSDILIANRDLPKSAWWGALPTWYADYILIGIRRQLKSGPESISLAGLLEDIAANPKELSRKNWRSLYAGTPIADRADSDFDAAFGDGRDHIDPEVPTSDLAILRREWDKCAGYTDKRVAHFDKGEPPRSPTFEDLDPILDHVEGVIKKYSLFVLSDNLTTLTPTIHAGWERVFDVPWRGTGS